MHREAFGAESFERPVLVPAARGRLAALPLVRDPGLQALVGRQPDRRRREHPGRAARVVYRATAAPRSRTRWSTGGADGCEMWLCCHPLDEPGHEDRMTTRRLTSADGLEWLDRGEVLAGRPGEWDARAPG